MVQNCIHESQGSLERKARWGRIRTGRAGIGPKWAILPALILCCAFSILAAGAAQSAEAAPAAPEADAAKTALADPEIDGDVRYPVSKFVLSYSPVNPSAEPAEQFTHPSNPSLEPFTWHGIVLGEAKDGYVAPREGIPSVTIQLDKFTGESVRYFYPSAIRTIAEALVEYVNKQGFVGVFVAPDSNDIEAKSAKELLKEPKKPSPKDLRKDRTTLRLVVWTTIIVRDRTIASGNRIPSDKRINNPAHARILKHSPIKPSVPGAAGAPSDLLRKDVLDAYVFRLNRHPGRRVDVAVSSAGEPGQGTLDYLVTEGKPWLLYTQVSNTGTEGTSNWRERLGFVHNQLTSRDDVLNFDYVTSNLNEVNAAVASYEAPLVGDRTRWRVYGTYSQYTASDVGVSNADFEGEEEDAGAEIAYNIFQRRQSFVDLVGGFHWRHVRVDQKVVKGQEDFALPYVSLQFERRTDTASTSAALGAEHNLSGVANTDTGDIEELGRSKAEAAWTILKMDFSHSFFVEPFFKAKQWEQKGLKDATMAHELLFSAKVQYAGDRRLIPQVEEVIGGKYTVRGYPESIASGDSTALGSLEYRYHIPRALRPEPIQRSTLFGRPFRWRPQTPLGRPDWDLVLCAFADAGHTWVTDPQSFERDEDLMGAGVGVELQVSRYANLRLDWGVALKKNKDINNPVDTGDSRIHLVATFLW